MDHSANYLDDHQDGGTIWPWVIGLLAILATIFTTAQASKSIPANVTANVRSAISAQNVTGVNLAVDGRDVSLSGTLKPNTDKRALLDKVKAAAGVRTVADNLVIYDPAAAAERRAAAFRAGLDAINVGELAFEQGSAEFAASSRPALDALAQLLLNHPEQRIRIAGHTDNTGRPAINLRISKERADAVAGYLVSRGAATSQVIARGFGASRPIADNSTEFGRAKNRRIEITYIN